MRPALFYDGSRLVIDQVHNDATLRETLHGKGGQFVLIIVTNCVHL